jgi:hypothetical protein
MYTQDNNETPRPQIDPSTLPWLACNCGGMIFDGGVMVKKLSALLSPNGQEEIIPAEIIVCKSCGKIPEFYAKRMRDLPADLISTSTEK